MPPAPTAVSRQPSAVRRIKRQTRSDYLRSMDGSPHCGFLIVNVKVLDDLNGHGPRPPDRRKSRATTAPSCLAANVKQTAQKLWPLILRHAFSVTSSPRISSA